MGLIETWDTQVLPFWPQALFHRTGTEPLPASHRGNPSRSRPSFAAHPPIFGSESGEKRGESLSSRNLARPIPELWTACRAHLHRQPLPTKTCLAGTAEDLAPPVSQAVASPYLRELAPK